MMDGFLRILLSWARWTAGLSSACWGECVCVCVCVCSRLAQAKVISSQEFENFLERSKTLLVFVKNLPEDSLSHSPACLPYLWP